MGLILDGTTGISASGNISGGNIIVSGTVSAGTFNPASISVVGNVQGAYIIGNGSLLTAITGANVTGTVPSATGAASATTAGTVTTASQPNITSVGTLNSLAVTANITGGNLIYGSGVVSGTGSIYATAFVGSLTGTATTAVSATTAATVTTAAQPNITSVGTLTSLSVAGFTMSGNTITASGPTLTIDPNGSGGTDGLVVIGGNLQVNGNMTYINSNNVTTNDLTINMANNAATASAANGGGIEVGPAGAAYITLTYNSASNIWVASNGLSVVGVVQTAANVTGGNLLTGGLISATGQVTGSQFNGSGAGLTSIPGANVSGTVGSATTAATVTTAAQPNITSVGTLGSVYVSGAISVGGGIVNTAGNGVSNIGATGAYFNTVFAKATSAQYADLAEMYAADSGYAPGTVVSFGGAQEVTLSVVDSDRRVAGVISTNPSYLMNSTLNTPYAVPVALTGRVPTQVTGEVRKGDLMVSNGDGTARAEADPQVGAVIGKALADFTGDKGTIEIVVGRL